MSKSKYVLTGGPGSGKSSTILALEQLGEMVVREAAEDYIKLQQARGVMEPWKAEDFQDRILELQLLREDQAYAWITQKLFLDRGLLDGLAYYQIQGREPSEKMKEQLPGIKYDKVFLIENLGQCQTNQVRREQLEQALELERRQEENYRTRGYEVIRIGPGTPDERARRIIQLTK